MEMQEATAALGNILLVFYKARHVINYDPATVLLNIYLRHEKNPCKDLYVAIQRAASVHSS